MAYIDRNVISAIIKNVLILYENDVMRKAEMEENGKD